MLGVLNVDISLDTITVFIGLGRDLRLGTLNCALCCALFSAQVC